MPPPAANELGAGWAKMPVSAPKCLSAACRPPPRLLQFFHPHGGYPRGSLLRSPQNGFLEPLVAGVSTMFGLGTPEVVLILVIGVVLFGNRLPDVARALGKSVKALKQELQGVHDSIESP